MKNHKKHVFDLLPQLLNTTVIFLNLFPFHFSCDVDRHWVNEIDIYPISLEGCVCSVFLVSGYFCSWCAYTTWCSWWTLVHLYTEFRNLTSRYIRLNYTLLPRWDLLFLRCTAVVSFSKYSALLNPILKLWLKNIDVTATIGITVPALLISQAWFYDKDASAYT